jgi:DNA-binding transcriptional LysR family regulator
MVAEPNVCHARAMEQYWLGVELRHLAALEAIDAERSFRGAADRLGYVQSAVSQQLATLERLVGTRLVERARGHAGVELTEAGTILLGHAERILAALSAARADLESLTSTAGRRLRVGTFESVATRVMPHVLANLATSHPELHVEATEASTDRGLFDAVAQGELDCAFAELPLEHGPFRAVELMVDPSVLVVATTSALARSEQSPTLEGIAELPLASPNWPMMDLIGEHFANVGLEPNQRFALESNAAVQAMVATGLAAAIMPQLAVDPAVAETTAIDVSAILPSRNLVLYWHRDRMSGPTLDAFVAATHTVCRQLGGRRLRDADVAVSTERFRRACKVAPVDLADTDDTATALAS